jgi:hypothetical protein
MAAYYLKVGVRFVKEYSPIKKTPLTTPLPHKLVSILLTVPKANCFGTRYTNTCVT